MKKTVENALGKTPKKESAKKLIEKYSKEINKRMTERLLKERNL